MYRVELDEEEKMYIEDFHGSEYCYNKEQLSIVMKKRNKQGYNEFWICINEEQTYPCIVVLVYKNIAYLHYFEEEGNSGWTSVADQINRSNEKGMTKFYTNNGTEEVMIENRAIVTVDKAVETVVEFINTNKMPKCIEWEEL